MSKWSVRYVHKVSSSSKDVGPTVELSDNAFSNRNTLAAALRKKHVLMAGARVRDFRVEANRVVVFPSMPGMTTYWHSVILTHEG